MRPADAQPVPSGRENEVAEFVDRVRRWAPGRADLRAVALVGSWARGDPHADSDVDIVLLTDTPTAYIRHFEWARALGAVVDLRTQRWGVLTERRMALGNGLVVEFGVVEPVWASTTPVDAGTARVINDGAIALHDPSAVVAGLIVACAARRT